MALDYKQKYKLVLG